MTTYLYEVVRGELYLETETQPKTTDWATMTTTNPTMRINTSDNYEWRTGLYDDVDDLLDENTRSGAVDASCEFTREMIHNLERAVEHPDMTPELTALLSTSQVELEYEIQSSVEVRD